MRFFSRLFNWNQVYGEPFIDKHGLWRIRIFRVKGLNQDNLFSSSIEDTYPTRKEAVKILKLVQEMEIR